MPNLDPGINRSSNNNNKTSIQNDNDNDECIEEKYLFEDNIDVFYNEDDDDDFEEVLDDYGNEEINNYNELNYFYY